MKKNFKDSWKHAFWRNFRTQELMTPGKFNFEMCPIRHLKKIIKFVETFQQFVMAADESGKVGVFLINETD